jgi:hypothetical protein
MALILIMIYHYTVTHWGDPVALAKTTWFVLLLQQFRHFDLMTSLTGAWKSVPDAV